MALYRAPNICPYCKKEIKWISNPPPPGSMFIGDTGGHYEDHNCPEERKFIEEQFRPLVITQGE